MRGALAAGVLLLFVLPCRAQIANVADDTSTPIPGTGHSYEKMLSETVNPANGSVSLRIGIPLPPGRGLDVPFSIDYDTSGERHVMDDGVGNAYFAANTSYLAKDGWSYSVPMLSYFQIQYPSPKGGRYTCPINTAYVYTGPQGDRHSFPIALNLLNAVNYCSTLTSHTSGGDGFYSATTSLSTTAPVTVYNTSGTVFDFPTTAPHETDVDTNFTFQDLPDFVEDTNGNRINVTDSGNGAFSYTDTLGRQELAVSGFGQSGNTITVPDLSGPVTTTWGTISYNMPSPNAIQLNADSYCKPPVGVAGSTETAITAISLPNNTQYTFAYDPTYGLLSKVTYPSGGYVRYVWGWSPLAEFGVWPDGNGSTSGCQYQYDSVALLHRYVSFDGNPSHEVLQQDYSYSTTWNGSNESQWTSKTTTVTTTVRALNASGGLVTTGSFTKTYVYTPLTVAHPPYMFSSYANQMPQEQTITTDGGGPARVTLNETWLGTTIASKQTVLSGGQTSEVDYGGCSATNRFPTAEYDYGPGSRGALIKSKVVTCATFPQTPLGTYITDKASSIQTYNGSGQLVAQTDYAYDQTSAGSPSSLPTQHDDTNYGVGSSAPRGNVTTVTRRCLSNCPGDSTTVYTYDDTGQVLSVRDPNQHTTQYDYDDYDAYLSRITFPPTNGVSHVEQFGYDFNTGELTSSIDQNQQPAHYYYNDSFKRPTEFDYPDSGKTTFSYNDAPPNPSATTDKLLSSGVWANPTTTTMDGVGHAIQVLGENGASTYMTYDGEGALYTETNPGDPSHYITHNHDALGRLISTVYQDGNTATVSYNGNCATTTDPAGKTNTTCMDALGRITSDTDGLSNTTTYAYDALDNLTSVSQGAQSRSFLYNSLSEMYQATNPESGTTSYTYDGDGNVLTRIRPAANQTDPNVTTTTTYTYDADNRLTSKAYSDGTPTVTMTYDQSSVTIGNWTSSGLLYPVGRMTEATTTASGGTQTALVYSYDPMGRVADLWQCAPYNCGNSSIWHMAYSYNLAGDVLSYTNPAGFAVTRTIDSAQQVTSQTYGTNMAVSSITYTPSGAISTMCGGQGCAQSQETRQYNSRLQPVLMELGNSTNPSADYSLAYSYTPSPTASCSTQQGAGDNGNVMGATYTDNVNSGYSHTYTYCYDDVNRLTHAVASGSPAYDLAYQYDQYGNGWCVGGSGGGVCPAVNYNSSTNQLTSVGGATPITVNYDAAGDQLNDQYFTYQYDAEGRVTSSSATGQWQYPVYNALGQRVEDYQSAGSSDSLKLYYPRDIFGQRTGIWDDHSSVNWVGWDVYWSHVAGQRLNMGGSSAYIDHADAIGSTLMETDPAGTVDWDVTRYPWGRVWQQSGTRGSAVFAGLDWQVNDPLYPSATREYNFRIYRWMTPDPGDLAGAVESNPQTWNEYAYALNNPLRYTDTFGGSAQDRVNAAYKLVEVGIPYKYGGKNASPCGGLDCSGFTEAVFQADLDNTIVALGTMQNAAMQYGDLLRGGLITTNLSQAQPGDAIFFKDPKTGMISHVGIVLGVSNSYISFADEPHSGHGVKARFEVMNRVKSTWGGEIFAGLGRPIEPAPGRGHLAQPPLPASPGSPGGLANWLEELFFNEAAQSDPTDQVHSNLCGGPGEPPCAQ